MGRHSAPDDDRDGDVRLADPRAAQAHRHGRHALPDNDTSQPADWDRRSEAVPEPPGPATRLRKRVRRGSQSSAADLELLRDHSDVRARVIAGAVVPFLIYSLVMYLTGRLGEYLLWAWVPLIAAGVLAGSMLDAAYRKRARDEPD
jgi:hypothetical protein